MKKLLLCMLLSAPAFGKPTELRIGGKCVDVPSQKFQNGVQLQLWDCNGTAAQKFELSEPTVTTPVDPPPPVSTGKCDGLPAWSSGAQYGIGARVVYKNQIFTAQNQASQGMDPIISYWFWKAGEKCDSVTVTPPPEDPKDPPVVTPVQNGDKEIAVYFQSWSAPWASRGADHSLAKLPPYVTTVLLAFVRPEAAYTSGNSLSSIGLDFSSDPVVIKEAVAIAKSQGKKILLSVGGATYDKWDSYNVEGSIALMNYLGADGIDLDYEDLNQICAWSTGGSGCPKDRAFISLIKKTKEKLPSGKLLTTAAWSTGAYGEDRYHASKMDGRQIGSNFGLYRTPLKEVGHLFDRIYIMAYDAGGPETTGYSWKTAYEAYRTLYRGRLVIGVEACPEAWGGHCSDGVDAKERAVASNGIMLWSWQKPGGTALAQAACSQLGMSGCAQAVPPMRELVAADSAKFSGREYHMRPERTIRGASRPQIMEGK